VGLGGGGVVRKLKTGMYRYLPSNLGRVETVEGELRFMYMSWLLLCLPDFCEPTHSVWLTMILIGSVCLLSAVCCSFLQIN
jgi:hypothetical protein